MTIKRVIPMLLIAFALAGCFRQSNDSFDTISSGANDNNTNDAPVVLTERPTTNDDMPTEAPTTDFDAQAEATEVEPVNDQPTAIPPTDEPTDEPATAIPTEQEIITIDPTPVPDGASDGTPQFITPEPVIELVEPTPLPSPTTIDIVEDTSNLNNNTSSDDNDSTTVTANDECVHTVVGGDTLFGIARQYGVFLNDLLVLNDLTDTSIIRPGDEYLIPDCGDNIVPATPQPTEIVRDDTTTGEQQVYRVASGDTLSGIASRFGITLRELMDANDITNPDRLSIGQELIIPSDEEEAPAAEVTEEATPADDTDETSGE